MIDMPIRKLLFTYWNRLPVFGSVQIMKIVSSRTSRQNMTIIYRNTLCFVIGSQIPVRLSGILWNRREFSQGRLADSHVSIQVVSEVDKYARLERINHPNSQNSRNILSGCWELVHLLIKDIWQARLLRPNQKAKAKPKDAEIPIYALP